MAAADTARLIATLELQDKNFTKNIDRMSKSLGGLGAKSTAVGTAVGVGIERLAEKGIGFLFDQVREGNATLVQLQEITAATGAVIASTGGKAGVTAQQVRDMAESLEDVTTADDKVIQSGENMLLTFTNIGSNIFPTATKAMVDMAIAMNNGSTEGLDLKTTAIQIGKALQDPIKGVTALRKVGVALTKQQEDQIKALVKAGKLEEAQKVILAELAVEFGNAGEAAGKSGANGLRRLQDAVEDSQLALAEGLAPALEDIRGELTKALSNPQTQQDIRNLGKWLGDAAKNGIEFAKSVPWGTIGEGLRTAADWAGKLFDVFIHLPPEVQGTIIALAGLNKLSGGAVAGLAGELGKGLIKGVLGMTAGVVNVRAGVVNGAGGAPGVGGAAGGAAGKLGNAVRILGTVALAAGSVALIADLLDKKKQQTAENVAGEKALLTQTSTFADTASVSEMKNSLAGIEKYTQELNWGLTPEAIAYQLNIDGVRDAIDQSKETLRDSIATAEQAQAAAIARGDGSYDAVERLRGQVAALDATTSSGLSATAYAGQQAAAAIRDKDLSVRVTVPVTNYTTVTVRDQQIRARSASYAGTMIGGK